MLRLTSAEKIRINNLILDAMRKGIRLDFTMQAFETFLDSDCYRPLCSIKELLGIYWPLYKTQG